MQAAPSWLACRALACNAVGTAIACCALACTDSAPAGKRGAGGAPPDDSTLRHATFDSLEIWATPLEDYIAAGNAEHGAGQFLTAIHDLTVFEDRLYLSYGDANVNMGRTIPIGLRYFAAPDAPEAITEFVTDEEHIERYRTLDSELWAAGVDATEDAWLGNVYLRPRDGAWHKSRTLEGGVHVHDVGHFDGAHWAVGSGSAPRQWTDGDIYAHLWQSTDGGSTFSAVERVHNGGDGDARWVRMLPHEGKLYLFGYTSNAQFQVDALIGATFDGALEMLPEAHPLASVFVSETDTFDNGTGLIRGVDTSAEPLVQRAYFLSDHDARLVEGLVGYTVIDVFEHAATRERLLLVLDGDDYQPEPPIAGWTVRLFVTSDFVELTELFSFTTPTLPSSIALWRDHLFMGAEEGQVFRAALHR